MDVMAVLAVWAALVLVALAAALARLPGMVAEYEADTGQVAAGDARLLMCLHLLREHLGLAMLAGGAMLAGAVVWP